MNVKCRICGEFFCPPNDSLDLILEEIISSESVNI
jgi:ribosomal protein S27E